MKSFLNLKLGLIGIIFLTFLGCEERDNYDDDLPTTLNIINSFTGNESTATIDHLSGRVTLVLPPYSDITSVSVNIDAPDGVEVSIPSGTTLDLSEPVGFTASFAGKERNYQIYTRVLPNKIAFLGEFEDWDQFIANSDDDVVASAAWLQETFPNDFEYVYAGNINDIEFLQEFNVLFFYYDKVGDVELPSIITEKRNFLKKYFIDGGKLLLGGVGNGLIEAIDRDTSGYRTIFGTGTGASNPDTWAVGFTNSEVSSILLQDVEREENGDVNVIDAGYKEDHNNMWSFDPITSENKYAVFSSEQEADVLATWNHNVAVQGTGGIIVWRPTDEFAGTALTIGIGGMEWNMNDGRTNQFAENIRKIYKNAVDYLALQ